MIRFTTYDGAGAIDLFGEDESHHLVRKRHVRERQLLIGTGIDRLRETIRATYDEDQSTRCVLLLLQPSCKLNATQLSAVLVEQHHGV